MGNKLSSVKTVTKNLIRIFNALTDWIAGRIQIGFTNVLTFAVHIVIFCFNKVGIDQMKCP